MLPQKLQDVKSQHATYKRQSEELALVYDALKVDATTAADLDRWESKYDRVKHCANWLITDQYTLPDGSSSFVVSGASYCRVMLCPMCQWRRARRLYSDMLRIWDFTFSQYRDIEFDQHRNRVHPRLRALLLTLTVPNVSGDELRDTVGNMSAAWNRLKRYPEYKAIKGYYRCLEVTYNATTDKYHPHYHVLLLVDESYFSIGYVKKDRWRDIWRRCYGDHSIVAVDIRPLRGKTPEQLLKSLNETCKYTVKPSDFLRGSMVQKMGIVETLDKALDHVRRASFGGWLKDARMALKIDDDEMTDDKTTLPDGAKWAGSVWLHWASGVGDYVQS